MQMQQPKPNRKSGSLIPALLSILITVGFAVGILWNAQTVVDWWRLRGYTPDARVVTLANVTTMSDTGRHLFYVNHPQILSGNAFSSHCSIGAEKTVILGCYESGDNGIYLYDVTDQRLQGVIETTAAHEMLHAAYNRLSPSEKNRIDALLNNFYTNGLKDERVKQTIEAYQQSEPSELPNEMHSIFATEVAVLPPELETYYKQYFSSRGAIVAMAERYQAEFTSRRDKTVAYDTQLADLKKTIDTNQTKASSDRRKLESVSSQLQSLRRNGDDAAYNQLVGSYNSSVNAYNTLLGTIRSQIDRYNLIVGQRNAVALEERDLAKSLSGDASTQ